MPVRDGGRYRAIELGTVTMSARGPSVRVCRLGRANEQLCRHGLIGLSADYSRPAQPDTPPAAGTGAAFVDEFNSGGLKRGQDFHQAFDHTADHAVTGFHPLNGRKRNPRRLRQMPLVHTDQRSRRPHLCCGKQRNSPAKG